MKTQAVQVTADRDTLDTNGIIERSFDAFVMHYTIKLRKRFDKYRPIFEEYLSNTMLVSEIAKKHDINRYQVYQILERYHIPRRPISDVSLHRLRKLLGNPHVKHSLFKSDCQCFPCKWLRMQYRR